jgi:diguanylate cyclase (GGDEF)-like protein
VIEQTGELMGFNFSPDIIWVFDLDRHGFWWGNNNALKFWGLKEVQQLVDKDLSADTEGARKRTEQTFVKAAQLGLTQDPWTTYPNGQPKLMLMRHVAVLLGKERHRGIIAFMSEQPDSNIQPENLLFAEAVRYTTAMVSCYNLQGRRLFENPAYTEAYGNDVIDDEQSSLSNNDFVTRFVELEQGKQRLLDAQNQKYYPQEHHLRTKQGIRRHNVDIRSSRHPITGDYVLLVTEYDVTELNETIAALTATKDELNHLANYDQLTQLPTVLLTREHIDKSIQRAKRNQRIVAVMFVDLDGFKAVNDSYGHSAGDQLLKLVATRLQSSFRESDVVGRIGGDEFLVCLPELSQKKNAQSLANKALDALSQEFVVQDVKHQSHSVTVTASIGIAYFPDEGTDVDTLLRIADQKMYRAKHLGKNQFCDD